MAPRTYSVAGILAFTDSPAMSHDLNNPYAQSIVETIREPLLLLDEQLRVRQANRAFYRVFHVSEAEAVGVPLYQLGNGQWDLPILGRLLEEVLPQDHSIEGFEVTHDFPQIGRKVMLLNARRLEDSGATPLVLLAIQDVTEQRALAEALQERERSLTTLLANLPGVAYRCRNDVQWTVEFVSGGATALLGYTPEDLMETRVVHFGDLIHPQDRERVWQEVQAGLAQHAPFETVYRVHTARGEVKWVWERGCGAYDAGGQLLFLEGFITDITAQRQAEERLAVYSQQLERSNRELQEFAQVASHDLQEPLRKIQAFGDLLKKEYGPALPPEAHGYLTSMLNAAGRMRSLINALLGLARVTTQARPFVPVALDTLVREVLSDLETRLAETGGSVHVGELPTVLGDAAQLRQVFQNLIGNALKFHRTSVAPQVRVEAEAHSPEAERDVVVRIIDNGIGFEEKYLDRIFLPFERLHRRQDYEGTGMGLAICRKIVERHGGVLTARSAPGDGTTFTITLPRV